MPADEPVAALAGKSNTMLKKQAISSFGDHIGTVTDVAFDGDTGAIQSVLVDGEPVPADRLLGVGCVRRRAGGREDALNEDSAPRR